MHGPRRDLRPQLVSVQLLFPTDRWFGSLLLIDPLADLDAIHGSFGQGQAASASRLVGRCGGMLRPSGSSSPVSSKRTTPLQRRLQPCSGWAAVTRARSRSAASAMGHGGWCWHMVYSLRWPGSQMSWTGPTPSTITLLATVVNPLFCRSCDRRFFSAGASAREDFAYPKGDPACSSRWRGAVRQLSCAGLDGGSATSEAVPAEESAPDRPKVIASVQFRETPRAQSTYTSKTGAALTVSVLGRPGRGSCMERRLNRPGLDW
jgi:hypothetical protein